MPLHSSHSSNLSLPPPVLPPSANFTHCTFLHFNPVMMTTFTVIITLVTLPLFIFVLYVGNQRRRRHHSGAPTNHSDVFTFHMVVMGLVGLLALVVLCCGGYAGAPHVMWVGFDLFSMTYPGKMFFQCLTCVERYLAVVHPIVYLRLRKGVGVKIRNVSIACVWLLCVGFKGFLVLYYPDLPVVPILVLVVLVTVVVSYCSLRVLCALTRPGPGKVGGTRDSRMDQSKLRAFYTITVIMGVLLLWILGVLVFVALGYLLLGYAEGCLMTVCAIWFDIPNSLVLPLIFLHRFGKLPCSNVE